MADEVSKKGKKVKARPYSEEDVQSFYNGGVGGVRKLDPIGKAKPPTGKADPLDTAEIIKRMKDKARKADAAERE